MYQRVVNRLLIARLLSLLKTRIPLLGERGRARHYPPVELEIRWQGRKDSNPRPSVLETDALTRLSYAPVPPRHSTHPSMPTGAPRLASILLSAMASSDLPVLIVGDVHGDLERLFAALTPYPSDRWHTIFLGDLVDYGAFGVGALRYSRDRANSDVILGNHEVAMLWALRDPSRVGFWISIGGQPHDLDELGRDEPLQKWMRERPALLELTDHTLVEHCGNDAYLELISIAEEDPVAAINQKTHDLLRSGG